LPHLLRLQLETLLLLVAAKVEKLIIFPVVMVVLAAVAQVQITLLVAPVFLGKVIQVEQGTQLSLNMLVEAVAGQGRLV
jgi:hypothetical protein